MVRNYKPKTNRPNIDEIAMKKAISDVLHKTETPTSAAVKYNLKRQTINSRLMKIKKSGNAGSTTQAPVDSGHSSDDDDHRQYQNKYSSNQVFSKCQEDELASYLKNCSKLHHGLTYSMLRKFAYNYSKYKNLACPKSWEVNKQTGKDWLLGFMKRNPSISLRKPENISLARLNGFNKEAVSSFFENLRNLYERHHFAAKDIYNLDETGITTVMESPKVIAEKGLRAVSQVVSAERGSLVTMVGIISADGNHLPPIYVYPRIRMNERFLTGALTGSVALNSKSGWMIAEIFLDVLRHIKKNTNCTKENPILLLLDNHSSHCSLDAIIFCRENGINLLTFPPHTSHKLQPLDVTTFGPFKKYCKTSFSDFTVNNQKAISIYEIAELTAQPFLRAFCPENIVKGFAETGIFPFNRNIFSQSDYSRASSCNDNDGIEIPSTSSVTAATTPEILRPYPKITAKKTNVRSGRSCIFTDTPEKEKLEEKLEEKNRKENKTQLRQRKAAKVITFISSESEDETEVSYAESCMSGGKFDDFNDEDEGCIESTELCKELTDDEVLSVNNFVLAKFALNRPVFYVCQIISIENNLFTVKFFRKCAGKYIFIEPSIEDVSFISRSDVVMKLPEPIHPQGTSRAKNRYIFDTDLSKYYIK